MYVGGLINPISDLEESAYNLFFYVPTYVDTALIISNRHLVPKPAIDMSAYATILRETNNTAQTSYMSTPKKTNSAFFNAVSQIYFVDTCSYGEKWLLDEGITLKDCRILAQQSFTRGLRAYVNFQWEKISQIY